jgi:hypothetical protein
MTLGQFERLKICSMFAKLARKVPPKFQIPKIDQKKLTSTWKSNPPVRDDPLSPGEM